MSYLSTGQYTHLRRDCPVTIDSHPADDVVEIAIGERHDTCARLAEALQEARKLLVG